MNTEAAVSGFPAQGVFYHWRRGFLLLTPSFVVDRGDYPTRRPSIRLMLARQGCVEVELVDGRRLQAPALLMAPEVERRQIVARDVGFVLLDMAIATPEYAALLPRLGHEAIIEPDMAVLAPLLPALEQAAAGALSGTEAGELRRALVKAVAGVGPAEPDYDPRIKAALAVISSSRLEEVSLKTVARAVHLSPDRLRHLFKQEMACTLSHHARTTAVWKALALQEPGLPLTTLAHEVGFHDSAHFSHAFRDMFGFKPSAFTGAGEMRFIQSE